jgi:hypothetical protein
MYTENPVEKPARTKLILVLVILALGIAILTSVPTFQNQLRKIFTSSDRVILARINAYFGVDQKEFLILKIKDASGLLIEVYEITKEESKQLYKQNFLLSQDSEAYITIDKNTTNLALSDVDKDGQADILAPSVDRNGNLRLNTFRYNSELQQFEVLSEN